MILRFFAVFSVHFALSAAEDAILASARDALDHAQPAQAIDLIGAHAKIAEYGPERALLARAQFAAGRARDALDTLGADRLEENWSDALWPQACAIAAEAAIASGAYPDRIVPWLEAAAVDKCMDADRAFALLAEQHLAAGHRDAALRYADRVWRSFARSPYHAAMGMMLAREYAESKPLLAREVLAALRADENLPSPARRSAAELLCKIVLPTRAGQCLVVAEQDMRRLPREELGALPLYRALALASLDAKQGLKALDELPPELAQSEAAQQVRDRLRKPSAVQTADPARTLELAEAAAELGHWSEAKSLAEPLARVQPAALVLLATAPDFKPLSYIDAPAARDVHGATALAGPLIDSGHGAEAWRLMQQALTTCSGETDDALAQALYWAWRSAGAAGQKDQETRLKARVLALPGDGLEIGLAWCAEAEALDRLGNDSCAAWRHAARSLPLEHPWQSAATWRAARALLAAGDSTAAEQVLSAVPSVASADHRRCRFMLAQLLADAGRREEALRAIETLRAVADVDQQRKLDRLVASCNASAAH